GQFHRVVYAGAESTYGPVSLDPNDTGIFTSRQEFIGTGGFMEEEANVHFGPILDFGGAIKSRKIIDGFVKQSGFFLTAGCHADQTPISLDPSKRQKGYVDRKHGTCIVQGFLLDKHPVIQHSW